MMKKKAPTGPTQAETRMRGVVGQLERQLKNESARAERAENALAASRSTSAGGGEVAELRRQIAELQRNHERLSKLRVGGLEESRSNSEKLGAVLHQITTLDYALGLDEMLARMADIIRAGVGFQRVLLRVVEPGSDRLTARAFAGLTESASSALRSGFLRVPLFESWLREDCRIGGAYYISHEHAASASIPKELRTDLGPRETGEWHSDDVLLVPLYTHDGQLIAYVSTHDPVDRRVPGRETLELLEIVGSHVVAAIESARRRDRLRHRGAKLDQIRRRDRERRSQLIGVMVIVSAEMRASLSGLRAAAGRLQLGRGGEISEALQGELDAIESHAERLNHLIDWALELRQPGSGRARLGRGIETLARVAGDTTRMDEPIGAGGSSQAA